MVSNLDENDQKTLIELFYSDSSVFSRVKPILKAEYFDKKFQPTINYLINFSDQFNTLPLLEQLNNESRIEYKKIDGIDNINTQKSILWMTEQFVKKRALELAVEEAYAHIAKGETSGIDKIIKDAQNICLQKDLGMNFWEKPKEWLEEQESEQGILSTGWKTFDDMMNGGFGWGELNYVVAPVNSGKCEIKGTKILMFDGSIKNIEDVKIGDKLMGPDSTPRTVLSTTNGHEKLYHIHFSGGNDMYVTGEHTLSLKTVNVDNEFPNLIHPVTKEKYGVNENLNITVNDYLKTSQTFRKRVKLWRTAINFNKQSINEFIDPYFLGVWLGDGSSNEAAITSIDEEIINYCIEYANDKDCQLRIAKKSNTNALSLHFHGNHNDGNGKYAVNHILKALKELNLLNNKHIPNSYLYNTQEIRKKILAGIIDTDGTYYPNKRTYEIIFKNGQLVNDTVMLARSLGYKVNVTIKKVKSYPQNVYKRITIVGDLIDIPLLLTRKKQKEKPFKNYQCSSFTIEQMDRESEYFGFELDKDNLYLHDDFVVTHNSLCQQNLALNWSTMGYNVLFLTLEMNRRLVGKRMASMISEIPYRDIRNNINGVSDKLICKRKDITPGILQIVDMPIGCNANDVEALIQEFEIETNKVANIIVVDYADIMKPCDKRINPENLNACDKAISLELRDIARERTRNGKNTMVLTASQITKDAMDEMEFSMGNIAGGTTKVQNADNIFSIKTNDAMRQRGEYEFKFLKTRNSGAKDKKLKMKFDVNTLLISDLEEVQVSNPVFNTTQNVQNAIASLQGLKQV